MTAPAFAEQPNIVSNSNFSIAKQNCYQPKAAATGLVNTARGVAKSYGERLRGCNVRNMNPKKAGGLSPELQRALEPLLSAIEELSEPIAEYNDRIEVLAQESYPQVALLKQIKGV